MHERKVESFLLTKFEIGEKKNKIFPSFSISLLKKIEFAWKKIKQTFTLITIKDFRALFIDFRFTFKHFWGFLALLSEWRRRAQSFFHVTFLDRDWEQKGNEMDIFFLRANIHFIFLSNWWEKCESKEVLTLSFSLNMRIS